jgi:hypothetical protein
MQNANHAGFRLSLSPLFPFSLLFPFLLALLQFIVRDGENLPHRFIKSGKLGRRFRLGLHLLTILASVSLFVKLCG